MIKSGNSLIEDLNFSKFQTKRAFWFYDEKEEEWWFVIESPTADIDLKGAIRSLQKVHKSGKHPDFSDIKVYGEKFLSGSSTLGNLKIQTLSEGYESDGIYVIK